MPRPPVPPADDATSPAVVGAVAFDALLRDGHALRVWGELAVTAGVAVSAEHRAAALGALVPSRAVLGRRTAAWVHTGGSAPSRAEVIVGPRRRRPDPHPLRVTHECALDPQDVVVVAGVRVTTVQRTGLDVARWTSPDTARRVLLRLCSAGFDPAAALRALDALPGHAGVRDARSTLARVASLSDEPTLRRG